MIARTLPDWLQGWAGQIQTVAEVVLILLLAMTIFPQIVLWLPQTMGYGGS